MRKKGMFDIFIDKHQNGLYITILWVFTIGVRAPVFETQDKRHRGLTFMCALHRMYFSINTSYATHDKVMTEDELKKIVNLKEFQG